MQVRSVEIQAPMNLILFSGYLIFCLGQSFSLLPTIDIINKASVFLPLLLRPEELPKFSVVSRAADKEFWVPLGFRGLFLKSSETFGPISGATMPFVSSQR